MTRRFFFALGLALFAGLYLRGAFFHSRVVNTNPNDWDQGTYISEAIGLKESGYASPTNRNQMPLYPLLISFFHTPFQSTEAFFNRAKSFNIILSAIFLLVLFFLFRKHLTLFSSINLALITAFTLFIFKAAYVQCELLYFFFSFLAFLFALRSLKEPSWTNGASTGVCFALGYLSKGSALPGFLLFLTVFIFLLVRSGFRNKDSALCFISALAAFFVLCAPYLAATKKIHGRFFYNVNSSYAMWQDNWADATKKLRAAQLEGTEEPLPQGPATYVKTHSIKQIARRSLVGSVEMLIISALSYGYLEYMAGYLIFTVIVALMAWKAFKKKLETMPAPAVFAGLYFAGYFLLYGFYVPIAPGPRFFQSLVIPFLFVLILISEGLAQGRMLPLKKRSLSLLALFNGFLLVMVAIDIINAFSWKLSRMPGGG